MIVEENKIKFEIDKENHCAKVIGCSYEVSDAFIPRFVKYDSQEFPIQRIAKEAFINNSKLRSINFPEDSELQTIERLAIGNGYIDNLYIPPSVVELEEGWCKNAGKLLKVTVSPNNKKFLDFNEDIIISKSDIQSDNYDILFFASREIGQIEIPSFIKKINPFAFSECDSLLHIKFPENSELEVIGKNAFELTIITRISIPKHVKIIGKSSFAQCTNLIKIDFDPDSELQVIEKDAFYNTDIEYLYIPASLNELKSGWCNGMKNLQRFSISPKNVYYSLFEEKMIVKKSNLNDDIYDTLCYVLNDIDNFVVPPFIKKIDDYALKGCELLSTVLFTEDTKVEVIGKYAFPTSIINITFPKSVTTIDDNAFDGYSCDECSPLKEVIFPDDSNLTVIGKNSFHYTSITSISIPKHVRRIDENAFHGCSKLKEIKFAKDSELEIIGKGAFSSTAIESIVIPRNVEEIEEDAFSDCTSLKEFSIEEGSKVRIIGKAAFYKTKISELILPSSIRELERGWCEYMNELNLVKIEAPNEHFKVLDNKIIVGKSRSNKSANDDDEYSVLYYAPHDIKEVVIPSYIKEIYSFAFSGCNMLKKVTFEEGSQLEKISNDSFSYSALTEICIPKHAKIIDDFAFHKSSLEKITFADDSELEVIGTKAFYQSSIESVSIPSSVTEIKENAFLCCHMLESFEFVDIQNSKIQSISEGMLSISLIKSIAIPNSVKTIEESAFYNCSRLKEVDFTDDSQLTTIGSIAFSECPIEEFHIPPLVRYFKENSISTKTNKISVSPKNEYLSVIDGTMIVCQSDTILYALRNIEEATIPSCIKKIDYESFRYCKSLRKIEFAPNSELEIIGKHSFDSSGITSISIPDHVKIIDDYAFYSCYSLEEIKFTDNSELEIIGERAFEECPISHLSIPKTVKTIRKSAFAVNMYGMGEIMTVEFPTDSMLENLGESSFLNYKQESLFIPKHVKEIKKNTFDFSSLENITFAEDSELEIIQDYSLSRSLESINFPSHLKELGRYWAQNTNKLVNITISPNNQFYKYLDDKIIVYNNDTIVFALRDIEHAFIPSHIKRINSYAFAYCKGLKSVEIEENSELEIIDDAAFESTSMTNLIIPNKVKTIGMNCFTCSSLQSITFPDDSELNFIGHHAFASSKIEKFVFPNRDILIQMGIFHDCRMKEIVVSDSIDSVYPIISYSSFEKIFIPPKIDDLRYIDFKFLKEIRISPNNKYFADIDGQMVVKKSNPDSEVYDILYESLKSIQKVVIPSYIKVISSSVFENCKSIDSVEFAENSQLEIIESYAFMNSSINNKIIFPKTVRIIKSCAFSSCQNLETLDISECSKLTVLRNCVLNRSSITSILIPKHVRRIDESAFNGCSKLKEVKFAKDSELEIICKDAFSSTAIESIVIPRNVEEIEEDAFSDCTSLKEFSFEEGSKVRIIGKTAFYKTKISELILPSSICELERGWCKYTNELNLVKIEAPNEHFKVLDNKIIVGKSRSNKSANDDDDDDNPFDAIVFAPRDIEQIKIPSYIRRIDSYSFSGCSKIHSVSFEKDSKLEEMSSESFSYSSIRNVFIPKNVNLIGKSCFLSCKNLTNVDFDPDANAEIKDSAFGKTALKGMIIPRLIDIKYAIFGFNDVKVRSFEFLGDEVNLGRYCITNSVFILSFPNARSVGIQVLYKYHDEFRIHVLPNVQINLIGSHDDSSSDYD